MFSVSLKTQQGKNLWLRFALVAAWMGVIFAFSAQAHSGEITREYLGPFNLIVRKAAHMTEYAVLYMLLFWSFGGTKLKAGVFARYVAFSITVLYAFSDEYHQYFVPGRSPSLADILVDFSGALIAWLVVRYWLAVRSRWSTTQS